MSKKYFLVILIIICNCVQKFSSTIVIHNNNIKNITEQSYIKTIKFVSNQYDFIIVGAGPAGCVLANRLSENRNWKILLVEAGDWENVIVRIPAFAANLQSTNYNWGYTTEPQPGFCRGMDEQRCGFPRGKGVGGSSLINYMIYNRGNHRDFDRWAEAGNPGWSYNEILQYFLKSEMASLKGLENSPYHNKTGPLSVTDVPFRSKIVEAFIKACVDAGHAKVDYNGESQMGTSYVQANLLKGKRHSAYDAYIDPIYLKRTNLRIITNAVVTKINILSSTKIAYGIEYVRNNILYKVNASKEIILSAGTFNSAKLLILSGVGPKDHLQEIEVPLIKNLPVGLTMWDHMSHFAPTFRINTTGESIHLQDFLNPITQIQYLNGKGKQTSIGGVEALTFIKSPTSSDPADFPDLELIFIIGSLASDKGSGIRKGMRITEEIYTRVYKPLENLKIDVFSIMVMLFHPKSKGYMKLRDKNPFNSPLFYPGYFSNVQDVETILHGIKEAIRISKQPSLKSFDAKLHDIPLPGCTNFQFDSDDYWRCSIRTLSATLHHQVGTCKMGPENDSTTVVNHELKVHGIIRLRVVDTSIIPLPPTSHTNAASYMIGEKAADMIRRYWNS